MNELKNLNKLKTIIQVCLNFYSVNYDLELYF